MDLRKTQRRVVDIYKAVDSLNTIGIKSAGMIQFVGEQLELINQELVDAINKEKEGGHDELQTPENAIS